MTTVTQVDRDAAAPFAVGHGYLANGRDYSGDYMVRNGHWDDKPLVQAFAAHREAAEARAREEGAKAMQWPEQWPLGTRVRKRKGSSWQGRVVGYYSTHLTPRGYAVESEREPGSVQIYPKAALEALDPAQIAGGKP